MTAAPAAAAAPWSVPAAVPGSPATAPTVAFNAGGVGVLTGDTGGGASSGAVGPHTVGTIADDADGFPGPITAFTATNFALGSRLALYGLGRIVGMGTHFSSADDRAGIVFGDAGEKLTNVHFVGPTDRAGAAQALAANNRGDVAATFGVCSNGACAHQSLFLVVRRSGGAVQSSLRMDNVAVGNISTVAINDRGDMLVAWQANGGVFARIRTAGGTLYRTERLGNPGEPVRAISAVLTPNRGAAVAWEAAVGGRGHARVAGDGRRVDEGRRREPPLPLLPAPRPRPDARDRPVRERARGEGRAQRRRADHRGVDGVRPGPLHRPGGGAERIAASGPASRSPTRPSTRSSPTSTPGRAPSSRSPGAPASPAPTRAPAPPASAPPCAAPAARRSRRPRRSSRALRRSTRRSASTRRRASS